jgi:hypothetical protein
MTSSKALDLTALLEIDADLFIRQNAEAIDDGHQPVMSGTSSKTYSRSHSSKDNFLSIPSSISLRSIFSCEIEYSSLLGRVRV